MLSVGPSVDFFLSLILWKPQHLIFIFCWNFHCQLKSNLGPLLERCGSHREGGGGSKLPKFANDSTDRLREMQKKGREGV